MERRELTVREFKDRLRIQSEEKNILLSASIELTNRCCFRCPHCYMDSKALGYLPLSSFEGIVTELKNLGCVYLTITGGEALLHPEFEKMYLFAHSKGFIISVFSNGFLLDKFIDLFAQYRPYEIDVTLYGMDDLSYVQNTGVSAWERVNSNLTMLKERGISFSVKASVTYSIYPLLRQMEEYAKSLSVTFRSDLYIYLTQAQAKYVKRLSPTEISTELLSNPGYIELERNALSNGDSEDNHFEYNCHPGSNNIYITWNTLAKMCPFTSDEHAIPLGENGKTVADAREYLHSFRCQKIPKTSKCYDCIYISTCRRCPERFYIETGDYNSPPCWMCEVASCIYDGIL